MSIVSTNRSRHARWSASRHLQIMAGLLAMLVACPFTAPFRVCKTPQMATVAGSHVHRSAQPSDIARVEADAVPLVAPPSVADDPLKEDVLLPEAHAVTVTASHASAAPLVVDGPSVLRTIVGALRL